MESGIGGSGHGALPISSINNYDIGRQLGKGGFAVVYQGRYRLSSSPDFLTKNIAIKFINKKLTKEKEMISRVQNEIKIHSSLSHPSIVKLFHSFEDENYVYLILELCPHGTLFHYLKQRGPLSESLTAKYCFQILSALEYLQQSQHGVIHRDMKLSNLLLDENYNLKLCDFGLAVQLEHPDEEHFTICGTPNYIAPEIASQQSHGFPADIWSLGCLCYSMLTGGTLPFAHKGGVQETLKRIVAGEYAIPSHIQISQSALSFLGMILHVDPFHRASVTQLIHHPFILSNVFVDRPSDLQDHPESHSRASQIPSHDSPSYHTTSTALQSYDSRSQLTNQTHDRYVSQNTQNSQRTRRERDFNKSAPILEHEEFQEKERGQQSHSVRHHEGTAGPNSSEANRLLPPKVSREPELTTDQKRSKVPNLNQIESNSSLRYSSERSDVSRSVVYLPSQRHTHDSDTSHSTRHSHDGVISTHHRSHSSFQSRSSYLQQQQQLLQLQLQQQRHQHDQQQQQRQPQSSRRYESDSTDRRLRSSHLNQSSESPFQYVHSSTDSINGSLLSLSLSSIGSFSHRQHHHTSADPLSSQDRHHPLSPSRTSKYSSSSTVSSLSPQSPETYRSSRKPSTDMLTPVLWTQRLSKRSLKSTLPSSSLGPPSASPAQAALSFCYCSPQGDVLAISSCGDVVYCTYLPDCHGKLKPCRLLVRSSQPLILSLGKVNHEMCQTIKSLTAVYGPDAVCANESLLQQEGIYSSHSSLRDCDCDNPMSIFADILWIKQYRIHQLEGRLKKVYYRVYEMIQMAQKKIPKLILYLIGPDNDKDKGTEGGGGSGDSSSGGPPTQGPSTSTVMCKCMLMSNLPFPDFYVRWSDGMKLHYSLSDGRLIVNTAPSHSVSTSASARAHSQSDERTSGSSRRSSGEMLYRWDQQGMADGSDWTVSAPEEVKVYLLQAQKAMKRCLLEEGQWGRSSNSTEPNVLIEKIENLQ